ncbi:MAG: hypothetical protein KBF88_13055 [Polyangiaceae bacterium]|nr:hypothetical protein [Polyangiaceae bacterium]
MKHWKVWGTLGLIAGSLSFALSTHPVEAKAGAESNYSYEQTWNAAIRLVRIDYGFKVVEKDDSTGYIVFEYKSNESGPGATSGAFEIVRGRTSGGVNVSVSLPKMPRYHEQVMLDALQRKLRDEYGEPVKREKPPEVKPDAGISESY